MCIDDKAGRMAPETPEVACPRKRILHRNSHEKKWLRVFRLFEVSTTHLNQNPENSSNEAPAGFGTPEALLKRGCFSAPTGPSSGPLSCGGVTHRLHFAIRQTRSGCIDRWGFVSVPTRIGEHDLCRKRQHACALRRRTPRRFGEGKTAAQIPTDQSAKRRNRRTACTPHALVIVAFQCNSPVQRLNKRMAELGSALFCVTSLVIRNRRLRGKNRRNSRVGW